MRSWQHPELGVLSQQRCVQLAEQTGVMHAVGQWLLCTAAEQGRCMGIAYCRLPGQDLRAMGVRPLTECDEELLANAGIVVEIDDAGDLVYCYAATGTRIEDPARHMVPTPASTAPRGGAGGGESPVPETDQAAGEPGEMTGEPDKDIPSSPSRRQRRILVGATAALAVTGTALLLPVNLLPDWATPVTPPGSPPVARPTVPLSITQWEHSARARLADITAQLQHVEAALRAWDAMPAHRREGPIPEQVTRLRERAVELRRQHAALSADLAAVEQLRAATAELSETQTQLAEVQRALTWPFAPRSEPATTRLREQEAMLTEQLSSQQATVQGWQIGVESAISAPLPASADATTLAGEVIALVEQPTDPTPQPLDHDTQPAAREPELLPAVALPLEPDPDNEDDEPGEPGIVEDVDDTPVTAIPAPTLGAPAQPVEDPIKILTVVAELAPAAPPVPTPAPKMPLAAPAPPWAQPSQPIPQPAPAPASHTDIQRAVDIGAACAHRKAADLSRQDTAARFAAANHCRGEAFNEAPQQVRESMKTQIREELKPMR